MARAVAAWPAYFATKGLVGKHFAIRKGDLFFMQSKDYIRALGPAYGVPDAATKPFSELPYVRTVNVGSPAMFNQIRAQALSLEQAEKLVGAEA